MQNRIRIAAGFLAVSVVAAGCAKKDTDDKTEDSGKAMAATAAPVDMKAAEDEIRSLDALYFAAVKAKDVNALAAVYADDAVSMTPNVPALVGHDAIVKGNQDFLKLPNLTMTGGPDVIKVSDDGTLAYDAGKYSMTYTDSKGKTVKDEGKYLEVLRKIDGKWKVVSDANNSNMAPPKM